MDHLPTAKNPLYSYPQVPYFEDSRFTYSGPAETFKSRIDPRQIVSPNENWKRAYSSFVQQWLYFGTLSEFASIHKLPFQPRDFVQTADDGTEVISTKLLNDYLVAFILEDHRATGITLTGGNPSMKNIMDGTASGVMWHAGRTIHEILKRLQQGLREISASGDLDARVWDSLLILGSTLIRSAEAMFLGAHDPGRGNMSRHVSFAEFETRSIPPFSTNGHWCPRERRVMADLVKFGQCELAFLGQIDRGEHIELHKECDETKCIAYHVKDHANPMKHCLGDCGSKYFSDNGGRTCTTIGRGDGDLQLNDEHPSGEIVDGRGPSGEGPDSEKNDDKTIGDKGNEEKDDRIEAANPRGTIAPLAGITNWAKKVYDTTSRSLERSDQDHSSKENSQGETADSKGASGQASNGQMTDNKTAAVQSNGGESDDKEASDQKSAVTPLAGITNWAHKVYDNTSKSFGSVPAIVYREGEWATLGGKPQRKPGRIEIKKVPLIKSNLSGWANWPVEGWNLVAVSHVWADGLGNTDANEVPECQLARIQGIVNSFFKESQWPVPFWLDTIMIPKTVDHPTDADKAAKKTALRNMEWVYKNASKVIVLDHTLMNVGTEGMCPEEIGARIMSCPWARRLWTLQEGSISPAKLILEQRVLADFVYRMSGGPNAFPFPRPGREVAQVAHGCPEDTLHIEVEGKLHPAPQETSSPQVREASRYAPAPRSPSETTRRDQVRRESVAGNQATGRQSRLSSLESGLVVHPRRAARHVRPVVRAIRRLAHPPLHARHVLPRLQQAKRRESRARLADAFVRRLGRRAQCHRSAGSTVQTPLPRPLLRPRRHHLHGPRALRR